MYIRILNERFHDKKQLWNFAVISSQSVEVEAAVRSAVPRWSPRVTATAAVLGPLLCQRTAALINDRPFVIIQFTGSPDTKPFVFARICRRALGPLVSDDGVMVELHGSYSILPAHPVFTNITYKQARNKCRGAPALDTRYNEENQYNN